MKSLFFLLPGIAMVLGTGLYLGTSFEGLQPRFAVLGHSMGAAGALIAAELAEAP